jgi:hypothetical protein
VSPRRILFLAVAVALVTAACGGKPSPPAPDAAAPPPDAGSILADAGGVGDAGAVVDAGDGADAGAVDAGPPLPSWSAEPFPEKRSPMPKKEAWASAPKVAIDRTAPDDLFANWGCDARRLQEWIRIHCWAEGGIMLIGGNADGFSLAGEGIAVFPVRRGDRRVIEFYGADTTVNAHTTEPLARKPLPRLVFSEVWLKDDERPTLVASDYAVRWR